MTHALLRILATTESEAANAEHGSAVIPVTASIQEYDAYLLASAPSSHPHPPHFVGKEGDYARAKVAALAKMAAAAGKNIEPSTAQDAECARIEKINLEAAESLATKKKDDQ